MVSLLPIITPDSIGYTFLANSLLAITTISTNHISISILKPPEVVALVLVSSVLLLVSSTLLSKALIITFSTSQTPASVYTSTILFLTTIFVLPFTPPMGTKPFSAIAITSTDHNTRELSNLAEIYTIKVKYSSRDDSFICKLAIFPYTILGPIFHLR